MKAEDFIKAIAIINQDCLGSIPRREVFSLAKECQYMPVDEVIRLLKNEDLDLRLGAVSILDWKARNKKTSEDERKSIYNAYIDHHEWIDDWGLVDRAAPYVIGGYLFDKNREKLYELAKSEHPMERRTAIVSTYYFIRKKEIFDTFNIGEILVHDSEQSVQTAVGSWIREAGKLDENKLRNFLDQYAATMPRITLRYAIEKLDNETRKHYMKKKI